MTTDPDPDVARKYSLGKVFCMWCQREPMSEIIDGIAELIATDPELSLEPLPAPMRDAVWAELRAKYATLDLDAECLLIWGGTSTDPEATAAWLERCATRYRTYVKPRVKAWVAARLMGPAA